MPDFPHIEGRLADHDARLSSVEVGLSRMEKKQDDGFNEINDKLDRTPRAGTIDYGLLTIVGAFVSTLVGAVCAVGLIVAGNLSEKSDRNYENAQKAQDRAESIQVGEMARNNAIENRVARLEGYLDAKKELGK